MKQAIILGKQTPDALIRLSPPSQRAWWIINKFSAVNREDAAPSTCQNTRLSAPTDCHFADGGPHRKLTRVKDVERRGSNYKCLADDAFVFRAMDLWVPRSGTLDIRTKSKLAENLRKQWNHWLWFIKTVTLFEMYWQEACSNYIVKSLTLISSDTSKKILFDLFEALSLIFLCLL